MIIITDGKREIVFSKYKTKFKKLGNATQSTKELFKSKSNFNNGGGVDADYEKKILGFRNKLVQMNIGKNDSALNFAIKVIDMIVDGELVVNQQYSNGGGISDSEMNEILQDLERNYLQDRRGLNLNSDKEQIQNGRVMWENYPQGIQKRLYQYLKKYDIIGEYQNIWVGDLEKINNFKAKIKELKSNGYSVIQKISAPTKDRTKSSTTLTVEYSKASDSLPNNQINTDNNNNTINSNNDDEILFFDEFSKSI
jgi:hypothetical protein